MIPIFFCCCVVSSINSTFGRLHQADHIAEGLGPDDNTGNSLPHSLQIVCGFVYVPQNCEHSRVVRRGPLCLISMYKTQKNFEVEMTQRGLINMQTKE